MWGKVALAVAGFLYRNGGRTYVKTKVDDPDHAWDNAAMTLLDAILGGGGKTDGGTDPV